MDGMVLRYAEDEVVPEEIDGVGDADFGESDDAVGPDAVPDDDRTNSFGGDLYMLGWSRHGRSSG
jgi:hypothetical protein